MIHADGFVYTGWRDGCIRIMMVKVIQSEKSGMIITSSFVACISLTDILRITNEKNQVVKSLAVSGDQLYCGCSNGIFVVLNLNKFKKSCSSINAKAFDATAF